MIMIAVITVGESGGIEIATADENPVATFDDVSPCGTTVLTLGDYRLECWRDPDSRAFMCGVNDSSSNRLQTVTASEPARYLVYERDYIKEHLRRKSSAA